MASRTQLQRLADVATALNTGDGFQRLAKRWDMTRPGVHQWCKKHVSLAHRLALARNGMEQGAERRRDMNGRIREKVIAAHMADPTRKIQSIAQEIGCSTVRVWQIFQEQEFTRRPPERPEPIVIEPVPQKRVIAIRGSEYCQKLSLIDGELIRCMEPTKGHTYCPSCTMHLITLTDRVQPQPSQTKPVDWRKEGATRINRKTRAA